MDRTGRRPCYVLRGFQMQVLDETPEVRQAVLQLKRSVLRQARGKQITSG
jgi:hypothetical protein